MADVTKDPKDATAPLRPVNGWYSADDAPWSKDRGGIDVSRTVTETTRHVLTFVLQADKVRETFEELGNIMRKLEPVFRQTAQRVARKQRRCAPRRQRTSPWRLVHG